jgi:SNF family Na+-dependent transporter
MSQKPKEAWASRLGLVLAMAGNAVGLGNFLRFPAQAAGNGGGAFLIPYFVAFFLMGVPLMWIEWTMGRHGGQFRHHSAPGIFHTFGESRHWKYLGVLGLWSCLVIASYYLYIESWCITYAAKSIIGGFAGMDKEAVEKFFNSLTGKQPNQILAISGWGMAVFALCILINIYILSRGLAAGIELVAKIGMPILIVFAAVLAVRGLMISPGSDKQAVESAFTGLNFVWEPKFDRVANPATWLAAAGQIFFTLSIGMGSIHCYASYLREKDDVALTGATTAWTNEFCEVILGGTILLPVAVAYLGLNVVQAMVAGGSGFDLGFHVFPTLFNKWGAFGPVAGFMWFGLLFFAAITSSLAMGQPIMSFLQEEFGLARRKSALVLGGMILALAIPVAIFHDNSFFTEFDYWAGSLGLVVFAVIEAILFAWVFGMAKGWAEMNKGAELKIPRLFFYIIKYITPLFLLIILTAYVFMPEGAVAVEAKDGTTTVAKKGWEPYLTAPFTGKAPPRWAWSGDGMIGKLLHNDLPMPEPPAADADADARREYDDAVRFKGQLRFVRNIDRLVMVGVFVGLAAMVNVAWRKRRREGRA